MISKDCKSSDYSDWYRHCWNFYSSSHRCRYRRPFSRWYRLSFASKKFGTRCRYLSIRWNLGQSDCSFRVVENFECSLPLSVPAAVPHPRWYRLWKFASCGRSCREVSDPSGDVWMPSSIQVELSTLSKITGCSTVRGRKFLQSKSKELLAFSNKHNYLSVVLKLAPVLVDTPISELNGLSPQLYVAWVSNIRGGCSFDLHVLFRVFTGKAG